MTAIYTQEQMLKIRNENYTAGQKDERERILTAVEKMRPYIDENGVQWIIHYPAVIRAIKGEKK